MAIVIYFSLNE